MNEHEIRQATSRRDAAKSLLFTAQMIRQGGAAYNPSYSFGTS